MQMNDFTAIVPVVMFAGSLNLETDRRGSYLDVRHVTSPLRPLRAR